MSAPRRTLVLGLDVGDGPLLTRFAGEGALPHFARFLADGLHGELATTAEFLHVSAWPSVYTGVHPGAHGVYYTFQPRPGVQGAVRFADDQYGAPPFWSVFDDAGRDVIVLDAPYTAPVPGFGGLQVFEWGTWAHYRKPQVLPGSSARAVRAALGRYPLGLEANRVGMQALDPADLAPRLAEAVEAKGRALLRLMQARPWQLFVTVFGEMHAAAHYLWPEDRADEAALAPLRQVYAAWDEALGRVLAEADEDVDVLVVSGDGVGTNRAAWHLLPDVLAATGFSTPPGGGGPALPEDEPPPPSRGVLARVRDAIPGDLRQRVSGLLPTAVRDALMRKKAAEALDWSATRAFSLPTDLEGCVRVNLAGREPFGVVQPGPEFDALCAELAATLGALRDPATGRPAVRRVLVTDADAPGPRRAFLPDLVVHWAEDVALDALALPDGATVRGPSPDPRPGTHRPHGFVAARGAGIPRGERFFGGHVVDFAPTLLKRCGLPLPAHLAGRAWEELS